MSGKQGYSITTKRLRLRCRHPEWLETTQEFYNEIALFYYELLLAHPELWDGGSQKILRELEILSLPGREKRTPEKPLPWEKVPLYFRRAAANTGIAAAKSHVARSANTRARAAEKLNAAVVYYKGMYRDFSSEEITLKVWDGDQWNWLRCRLYGEPFPVEGEVMSPSVVLGQKFIMLHVPVKEPTAETATIRERMDRGDNICALQFTNSDAFAVGSIQDSKGQELAVRFCKGGKEYAHHCRQLMKKIEKSRKSLGDSPGNMPNRKYWMHLKHLGEHYAHQVSAEIVAYCQEHEATVIALPRYDKEYTRSVMYGSGDWSPLHLSTRIRQYLPYKAWKSGILVIEVNAKGISSVCAVCGGAVAASNRKSGEYICENGHTGNRHLNAARNLGKKCLTQFGKHVE